MKRSKMIKKSHGGARPGAGRPARTGDTPSKQYAFRLSEPERELLARLAYYLDASESDVLRRGLLELAERQGLGQTRKRPEP